MSSYQKGKKKKIIRDTKRQKTPFEETKQAAEPDTTVTFELTDQKFKIAV